MKLTEVEIDRAVGVILASAAGDALGANYEFKPPVPETSPIEMKSGTWAAGEWTDDTSMAIAILRPLTRGENLTSSQTQTEIVREWCEWAERAPDVGLHTRKLLASLNQRDAAEALKNSEKLHLQNPHTAGNGTLMRTGPVALGSLSSAEVTAQNAFILSRLTHWDATAAQACVLWSLAIRNAILTGEIDVRIGLQHLDLAARDFWLDLIDEAEANEPTHFENNGWVIHAFQAAVSAIHKALNVSQVERESERLKLGIEFAVRAGWDTDTVAAIAGSLLGAKYGLSAVPKEWFTKLHGQPLNSGEELVEMALAAVQNSN